MNLLIFRNDFLGYVLRSLAVAARLAAELLLLLLRVVCVRTETLELPSGTTARRKVNYAWTTRFLKRLLGVRIGAGRRRMRYRNDSATSRFAVLRHKWTIGLKINLYS